MTQIPILLSVLGKFNLSPNILPYSDLNINSLQLRYDPNLLNEYYKFGNSIAHNCFLKLDFIPFDIFNNKRWIIANNNDREVLVFYEQDGDVIMRKTIKSIS
jgi:hypothetical protein